jgi:riboflavin kinase / FMN adenylyltransferase
MPTETSVLTLGTFDGLHRGHAAVIAAMVAEARRRGRPGVIVTFEPHPLRLLQPASAPRLLTTPGEKRRLLEQCGADRVAVLPFDRELADLTPRQFVEQVLIPRFGLEHLVIGYDHGFGRGRSGDASVLERIGHELGFTVDVVPPLLVDGQPISSTRIRNALRNGDVAAAAHALGRPYALCGTVVPGDRLGHSLGFPTANLDIDDEVKLVPAHGVYAARTDIDGVRHDGLLHIGPRPTFDDDRPTIELHVLDFHGDLYGRPLEVRLCGRIRELERFDSADALIAAMTADRAAARALFAAGAGACRPSGVALA